MDEYDAYIDYLIDEAVEALWAAEYDEDPWAEDALMEEDIY